MKAFILLALVYLAVSLPYEDQITLTNSLIVGREDLSDLYEWTCKVCDPSNKPKHAHIIQEKAVDIKCIVSVYEKFIVLAFRYTNTALNVWQDILYPLQIADEHTCSNCKVQKAYNNMWETIKADVFRDLNQIKFQTNIQILYITGISLGGGLAVISYIDINHQNIFKIVLVTTYGAPRVGNKNWAKHFDDITGNKTMRYIVAGDPVVDMPKCLTLLCNYGYTGRKIVCTEATQICQQQNQTPDSSISPVKQFFKQYFRMQDEQDFQAITDHVEGYPKIYNHTLKTK